MSHAIGLAANDGVVMARSLISLLTTLISMKERYGLLMVNIYDNDNNNNSNNNSNW